MRKIYKSSTAKERIRPIKEWPVSMTIPDETYTIRDLIKKHASGVLPPNLERESQYTEEASHEDLDLQYVQRMDMHDKQEIISENLEFIQSLTAEKSAIPEGTSEARETAVPTDTSGSPRIGADGVNESNNKKENR